MVSKSRNNLTAIPGSREITMSRVFDAPREKMFATCTDPKLIPKWWGPAKYKTTVERMEVRKGGIWRNLQEGPDGKVYAFNGVYHESVPPERLIYTFEFEGFEPGHVALETIYFEELPDNKTRLRTVTVFQTVEDRDGMVQSGMEGGAVESWDRLERLVTSKKE